MNAIDIIDREFGERRFEVYSVATGESMSKAMKFSAASNELDRAAYGGIGAGGNGAVCSGIDIREVAIGMKVLVCMARHT